MTDFLTELRRLKVQASDLSKTRCVYSEFIRNHANEIEAPVEAAGVFVNDPRNATMMQLYDALAALNKKE